MTVREVWEILQEKLCIPMDYIRIVISAEKSLRQGIVGIAQLRSNVRLETSPTGDFFWVELDGDTKLSSVSSGSVSSSGVKNSTDAEDVVSCDEELVVLMSEPKPIHNDWLYFALERVSCFHGRKDSTIRAAYHYWMDCILKKGMVTRIVDSSHRSTEASETELDSTSVPELLEVLWPYICSLGDVSLVKGFLTALGILDTIPQLAGAKEESADDAHWELLLREDGRDASHALDFLLPRIRPGRFEFDLSRWKTQVDLNKVVVAPVPFEPVDSCSSCCFFPDFYAPGKRFRGTWAFGNSGPIDEKKTCCYFGLFGLAFHGSAELIRTLLRELPEGVLKVDTTGWQGQTALHAALANEQFEAADLLVDLMSSEAVRLATSAAPQQIKLRVVNVNGNAYEIRRKSDTGM